MQEQPLLVQAKLRKIMISMVLATDMKMHIGLMSAFQAKVDVQKLAKTKPVAVSSRRTSAPGEKEGGSGAFATASLLSLRSSYLALASTSVYTLVSTDLKCGRTVLLPKHASFQMYKRSKRFCVEVLFYISLFPLICSYFLA